MVGKAAFCLLSAMVLCALWGCGVATVPQLGAVSVTSDPATTPPTSISSLAINGKAFVNVAVGQDQENLGVNWAITCDGSSVEYQSGQTNPNPNPCGTITPVYTGSNINMVYTAPPSIPVDSTVTISAYVASDPSVSSSFVLTIIPLPIQIVLTGAPKSAQEGSEQISLIATVNNDTSAQGVSWSLTYGASGVACGSGSTNNCGTLVSSNNGTASNVTLSGSQMYYTTPPPATVAAGGATVNITATSIADSSKTASATISVAPISVAVAVSPSTTVPASTAATLTATVTYDIVDDGVTWSTTCSSTITACPTVSGTGGVTTLSSTSYSVAGSVSVPAAMPAGSTIAITATSKSDTSKSAPATITVGNPPPITVQVAPTNSTVQLGGTLSGTTSPIVTVTNDFSNLGVTWACTPVGVCGTAASGTMVVSSTSYVDSIPLVYSAPATMPTTNPVTVMATSIKDVSKSGSATITLVPKISVAFSPALPTPITAGTAASFSATVSNDITSSGGVDWTASCSNGVTPCGSFSPSHTASGVATQYTALLTMPLGSTVTVTATSTASKTVPALASATSTVRVTPVIQTSFVPYAPTQMLESNSTTNLSQPVTVGLSAVVANDSASTGVTWTVGGSSGPSCSSGGNQFLVSPQVTAVGTVQAASAQCVNTLTVPNGAAVAYIPPSSIPTSGKVTITATDATTASKTAAATATAVVNIVSTLTSNGVQLSGHVLAGSTPVAGAAVSLYAAGTGGYGSAATLVNINPSSTTSTTSVTTGNDGSFTIPAGYTCSSQSSLMYLVATGGNPGLTGSSTPNNGQLAMMTALGPCGGLSSTASIVIDEVTTVASVWALAPFMPSGGTNGAYAYVGSTKSNSTNGLANAFAAVNNLVNITTGQALTSTPAGNSVVPQAEIDTLADVLNTCTATKGGAVGDGSACATLFADTNPGLTNTTAPVDTIQAALNIAQNNSGGTGNPPSELYALLATAPAFTPTLATEPNDWTIALNFTGGGLGGPLGNSAYPYSRSKAFAIDATGNLWIANNHINSVSELNNLGVALSPSTPSTGTTLASGGGYKGGGQVSSPTGIAIDPTGNVWVLNNNGSLSELYGAWALYGSGTVSGAGAAVSTTTFTGGGLASGNGIAIDGAGNVWATSSGGLSEFAGSDTMVNNVLQANGTALSPSSGYTTGISTPSGGIAVDNAGTVWVLNSGNDTAAEYSSSAGTFTQADYGYTSIGPPLGNSVLNQGVGSSMVIDSAGNVFMVTGGSLIELYTGGSQTTDGGLGVSTALPSTATLLAADGAGHLWSVFPAPNNYCTVVSVVEMNSGGSSLNTNTPGCGYEGTSLGNTAMAVDGSGNLWVLNGTNSSSVTEFIGVATPVVTPFSLGVQNKTLGKKP